MYIYIYIIHIIYIYKIFFGLPCSSSNVVLNFICEVNGPRSNHSFNNYVLCFNYMPGRVLGAEDSAVNQIFLEGTVLKDGYIKSITDKATIGLGSCHAIRGCNIDICF